MATRPSAHRTPNASRSSRKLRIALLASPSFLIRRQSPPLAALLALCAGATVCLAQKDAGTIAGTIRDGSGAVVADVTVTATDVDRGATITVTSNASGEYVLQPLKVGRYAITAEKPGFSKVVSSPITSLCSSAPSAAACSRSATICRHSAKTRTASRSSKTPICSTWRVSATHPSRSI